MSPKTEACPSLKRRRVESYLWRIHSTCHCTAPDTRTCTSSSSDPSNTRQSLDTCQGDSQAEISTTPVSLPPREGSTQAEFHCSRELVIRTSKKSISKIQTRSVLILQSSYNYGDSCAVYTISSKTQSLTPRLHR